MKFGGASVATAQSFSRCAKIILNRLNSYQKVIVVVSAMQGMTDHLLHLSDQVSLQPPPREVDMLVSVGERISMSLLAMALNDLGCEAVSFTGSQTGIITCSSHNHAKIIDVNPYRIRPYLEKKKVVIVAGFQGVSRAGEITTLGRGGSDTTAVALGVALQACKVEFYKDVPGVFSQDPKKFPDSCFYSYLNYDEALSIVRQGAKVLHERCLHLAKVNELPLHIRSYREVDKSQQEGTWISKERRGFPSKKFCKVFEEM